MCWMRLGELDLQTTRQVEAVLDLHHVGNAALAALAVDADDGFVAAADVLRVDRQVRHAPDLVVVRVASGSRPSVSASKPFLIASWWLPLNDV